MFVLIVLIIGQKSFGQKVLKFMKNIDNIFQLTFIFIKIFPYKHILPKQRFYLLSIHF